MIFASLNPNLTMDDLQRLGDQRLEAMKKMGDTFIEGVERCPV